MNTIHLQLWCQPAQRGSSIALSPAMEQHAFNQMLGLTDLPLCGACSVLLKVWAESDNRIGRGDKAWAAFQAHRTLCSMQLTSVAAENHEAMLQPGKIFQAPGKLFLVIDDAAEFSQLPAELHEARTAA